MLQRWQTPRVDSLKLVSYPRIENAHKIRKTIFVFIMCLLYVQQLLRGKNRYGQGCSAKKEVWERRSLTGKKLL